MSRRPVVLDAGALIAIERGDERLRAVLELTLEQGIAVHVPAPVVAEVWRGGAGRQARLAAFLARGREREHLLFPALDVDVALQLGLLLARVRASRLSLADAMVAWCAIRLGGIVFSSDPDDLAQILPPEQIRVV